MITPAKTTQPRSRMTSPQADEREIWHKLVVKVIRWRDGLVASGSLSATDKITHKEWLTYSRKLVQTNLTNGKQKVLDTLKETKQKIIDNGGFADDVKKA